MDKGTIMILAGIVLCFFGFLCVIAGKTIFFPIMASVFGMAGIILCFAGYLKIDD